LLRGHLSIEVRLGKGVVCYLGEIMRCERKENMNVFLGCFFTSVSLNFLICALGKKMKGFSVIMNIKYLTQGMAHNRHLIKVQ
jgi:hypothetical protein